jgi:hypothetical protein
MPKEERNCCANIIDALRHAKVKSSASGLTPARKMRSMICRRLPKTVHSVNTALVLVMCFPE